MAGQIRSEVTENLVLARRAGRYKQSDIAKFLGVTTKSVSDWECGRTDPSYDTLDKLGEFYNLTGGGLWFFQADNELKTSAPRRQEEKLRPVDNKEDLLRRFLEFERKNGTDGGDSLTVCGREFAASFNTSKSFRTLLAGRLERAQNAIA